jgi:hypothetical protein
MAVLSLPRHHQFEEVIRRTRQNSEELGARERTKDLPYWAFDKKGQLRERQLGTCLFLCMPCTPSMVD